jgi:hypothetical protein
MTLTNPKLPNFFIVGAAKSGTTSLYYYLKQHPQIFMPTLKEPHYFSEINYSKCKGIIPFINSWSEYLNIFSNVSTEKAIGEASVSYLCHPGTANRINEKIPNAKIIIILRNPIERVFSHFLMDIREGKLSPESNFISTILLDSKKPSKKWGDSNLFLECGMYSKQIKEYIEAFGKDSILILTFDDLIKSKECFLKRIYAFLGIETQMPAEINSKLNTFALPKNKLSKRIYTNYYLRRFGNILVMDKYKGKRSINPTCSNMAKYEIFGVVL